MRKSENENVFIIFHYLSIIIITIIIIIIIWAFLACIHQSSSSRRDQGRSYRTIIRRQQTLEQGSIAVSCLDTSSPSALDQSSGRTTPIILQRSGQAEPLAASDNSSGPLRLCRPFHANWQEPYFYLFHVALLNRYGLMSAASIVIASPSRRPRRCTRGLT